MREAHRKGQNDRGALRGVGPAAQAPSVLHAALPGVLDVERVRVNGEEGRRRRRVARAWGRRARACACARVGGSCHGSRRHRGRRLRRSAGGRTTLATSLARESRQRSAADVLTRPAWTRIRLTGGTLRRPQREEGGEHDEPEERHSLNGTRHLGSTKAVLLSTPCVSACVLVCARPRVVLVCSLRASAALRALGRRRKPGDERTPLCETNVCSAPQGSGLNVDPEGCLDG